MSTELNIEDLKVEADALGIKYSPNIGVTTLKGKIDAFKAKSESEDDEFEPIVNKRVKDPRLTAKQKLNRRIREIRKKKLARSKVIVYNNDPREAEFSTTMSRVQNSYFGNARVIPIGVEWWVEQMHIDNLKSIEILTYVKDPKTGNMKPKKTKKFTIDIIDTDEAAALRKAMKK